MTAPDSLPPVAQRFLRYVQIDTQSDPRSPTTPSTEKQKDLGRLLVDELQAIGLPDAAMDDFGYVYATLPSPLPPEEAARLPVVALLAHMDTSPDESGAGVKPVIHRRYDGGVIVLPGNPDVRLDPARQPALLDHVGEDLITSDGTTLLGSDDKAGVAVLVQLAADLLHDDTPRPTVRLCFTVDEEIGRGVDRLDLDRLGADVGYTLDGSGIDSLSVETFNAARAVLTVRGVMVHPGYARDVMVNAVRILAEFISALPPTEAPETTDGRAGYLHPHHLAAGDPSEASVEVILRDFSEDGLARRKDLLRRLADALRLKYPKAQIDLTIEDQYKNMRAYIEAADPRVITFAHGAAQSMGIRLTEQLVRGGTDGARLSEMGLPTPNVFNGGYDYHSTFEWNTVQNLERSLAFTKALLHYWGRHGA
ncbi:MAG: peptidase T [Bacteroidetes bacterium]|nr:MAG: peptidase T [Bacteroidota bacterium]